MCATLGANAIAEAAYKILEIEKIKDSLGVTCNVGVINGGSVANTVAGKCSFEVDVRFANVSVGNTFSHFLTVENVQVGTIASGDSGSGDSGSSGSTTTGNVSTAFGYYANVQSINGTATNLVRGLVITA